ncbi:MAG: DUF1963 domain-containing protein [Verrucomicrobiota bacterium]
MSLYSNDELKELREFDDLNKALREPAEVIRFRANRYEDAAGLARIAELRNLQSLSISLSNVSQLLPRLGELTDLQELYLQACNISDFPESILNLPHLRLLVIGNNSLRHFPNEIGCLVKLEHLGLSQNQLQRIPDSISLLARLNTLALAYNKLETLPDSIGAIGQLGWLSLDANQLRHLPHTIGNLSRLQSLSLNSNALRTLPDSICNLHSLESLSIKHNPFDSLPSCISRMESLKDISIEAGKRSLLMDWSYQHSIKPPQIELTELKLFVTPKSELYEPLMRVIKEGELTEVASIIVDAAREAIAIESTVLDDYSQLGNSRLGGFPDLADPSVFPKTEDLYWIFLTQIDLADLAPLNSFLPRSGLLSFFLDSTEALDAKVIFYQGDPGKLITVRHGGAEEMISPDDDYTQTPYRVKFERFFSLPHQPPEGILGDQEYEAYEKCEALHEGVDHHINGYTFTQHESPQEQAASTLRGEPNEWVPLLKLGWDQQVGFCFWDAGTLTFTIHREDLRRWDFSTVHVSLESS